VRRKSLGRRGKHLEKVLAEKEGNSVGARILTGGKRESLALGTEGVAIWLTARVIWRNRGGISRGVQHSHSPNRLKKSRAGGDGCAQKKEVR